MIDISFIDHDNGNYYLGSFTYDTFHLGSVRRFCENITKCMKILCQGGREGCSSLDKRHL